MSILHLVPTPQATFTAGDFSEILIPPFTLSAISPASGEYISPLQSFSRLTDTERTFNRTANSETSMRRVSASDSVFVRRA